MRKHSALIAGILAGMEAPGQIFSRPAYPRVQGTDLDRIREDVARVGEQFTTVIDRENGKTAKQK